MLLRGGAGGAFVRLPGGGGGADELCFMPLLLLPLLGRVRSGKEGLCIRGTSGGEGLPLSGSSFNRLLLVDKGGFGADALELGTCNAGRLPWLSPPTGLSFGTPP